MEAQQPVQNNIESDLQKQNFSRFQKARQTNIIKQVIVVVGKLGQGKSSFIKMLVSEQDKLKIQVSSSVDSVTEMCTLYQLSSQAKKKFKIQQNQHIYLMDTPGMNSPSKNYLIMDQVKKQIMIERCDIIGIAYLKNSNDIRQDLKSSYIEFHKIFPVKRLIKQQLSFFIFTNVDKRIRSTSEFQKGKAQLKKLFSEQGLNFISKRSIDWISYPEEEKEKLLKKINGNKKAKQLFERQWLDVEQILKNRKETKCTFQQFQKGMIDYQINFRSQLLSFLNRSKQYVDDVCNIDFKTNKEDKIDQTLKAVGKSAVGASIIGGTALGAVQVVTIGMTFGFVILPLALGAGLIGAGVGYYRVKLKKRIGNFCRLVNKITSSYLVTLQDQQQQQLDRLNIQKVKQQYLADILSINKESKQHLLFKKAGFLKKINAKKKKYLLQNSKFQDVKLTTQDQVKLQNQQTVKVLKMELEQVTEYIFQFQIKRPTQKIINDITKKVAFNVYHQQK